MKVKIILVVLSAACMLLVSSAQAGGPAINGLTSVPRVFNDFPGSTLTITNGNSVNLGAGVSEVTIDDSVFGAGGFANRHDVRLSSDAGATEHTFNISDEFTFKAEVTLTDGSDTPRKEAGLRINGPATGDVLLLVNSDAGEIVAFGGGAPFHIFGSNGGGNGYTTGSQILLGFTYVGNPDPNNPGVTPAKINYFIDRHDGNGIINSGFGDFSNLEFGAENFNVAVYGQVTPNDPTLDFINANFDDIMYNAIPEPASIALACLGLVGMTVRRRR